MTWEAALRMVGREAAEHIMLVLMTSSGVVAAAAKAPDTAPMQKSSCRARTRGPSPPRFTQDPTPTPGLPPCRPAPMDAELESIADPLDSSSVRIVYHQAHMPVQYWMLQFEAHINATLH